MTPRQQTWSLLTRAALFLIVTFALYAPQLLSAPRYTVNSSADIRDGVIKNADVNASAAIDWTKINSGITITPTELNLFDPTGRTNGTVPTSNGSNSITWTGPYLTSYSETDPSSLHTSGGTMTGDILVSGSHDIGAVGSRWTNLYATNIFSNGQENITPQSGSATPLTIQPGGSFSGTALLTVVDASSNIRFEVRSNGSLSMNGSIFTRGTGSPNSAVTGSVGDIYIDSSGGAGTTFYVKESGSGTNTGWVGK